MTEEEARQILAGMSEGEAWNTIDGLVEQSIVQCHATQRGSLAAHRLSKVLRPLSAAPPAPSQARSAYLPLLRCL